jgi:hypothetical protein
VWFDRVRHNLASTWRQIFAHAGNSVDAAATPAFS